MQILQQIFLGIVQGILEWIPVSSEGFLLYIQANFLQDFNFQNFLRIALFLHLGTFFSALIYFRKDVIYLTKNFFNYKKTNLPTRKTINFLIVTTLISGIIGIFLLQFLNYISTEFSLTGKVLNISLAVLLLITGVLQISSSRKKEKIRNLEDLNSRDNILLGFFQGLAVLPGLSRSGLTVSALLLRKIDDKTALKLSFLMSLPIVLGANIFLNFNDLVFFKEMFFGFLFAFLFGILTIHLLIKLAEKIKFGYFVIIISILMFLAVLF